MDSKNFRRTLSERLGRTAKDVDALTLAMVRLIVDNAQQQKGLAFPGFGSFVPVKHDEQIVKDLSSGKRLLLPPEIVVEYRPGSAMRRAVDPDAPAPADAPQPAGGLLTLHAAAGEMSQLLSVEPGDAESFIHELCKLAEEEVGAGNSVQIKGLGEFSGLSFRPDFALAEEVNQPFSMFEPVELDDQVEEADLDSGLTSISKPEHEPSEEASDAPVELEAQEEPAAVETVADVEEESEPIVPAEEEPELPEYSQPYHDHGRSSRKRCRLLCMLLTALLIIAAFAGGFFAGRYTAPVITREIIRMDTVRLERVDTVVEPPVVAEEPVKEPDPIYDTVTPTRYLATMAREYYGKMDYWVYIYKENEDKLGNPDKIRPGTRVVIPPIEKYATAGSDSLNLLQAQNLSAEIYAPYRR